LHDLTSVRCEDVALIVVIGASGKGFTGGNGGFTRMALRPLKLPVLRISDRFSSVSSDTFLDVVLAIKAFPIHSRIPTQLGPG
jgi:hypothetical protein